MSKLRTAIQISADGRAAARTFQQLKDDAGELDDANQKAGVSMASIGDAADSLPGPLGEAAALLNGPAGAVAGAVAFGAAMFSAAKAAIEVGEEAQTTAFALNSTVEEASRLNVAMEQFGIEANDAVDIALQVTGALADSTELAEQLGYAAGEVIPPMDGVKAAIDNWDLLTPVQRMKLFGEEGVRQIAKMQRDGRSLSEIMAGLSDFQVVDQREAAELEKVNRKMREWESLAEGVKTEVGIGVVEGLNDTENVLERIAGQVGRGNVANLADWAEAATPGVFGLVGALFGLAGVLSDDLYGALDSTNSKFQALPSSIDESTGAIGEAATATAGWETKVRSLDKAFSEIREAIQLDQQIADLDAQFDELTGAAWRYADAVVNGNGDAVAAQKEYETELRTTQLEVEAIGRKIGLLPDTVQTIIDVGDNGSIEEMETRIQNLIRNRQLWVQVRTDNLPGQGGPSDPWTQWDAPAQPATVVNVTMHGQASSREMANAVAQWTANG